MPEATTRGRCEMKVGFVIQTAAALYLLLSPAQVGTRKASLTVDLSSKAHM